MIKLTPSEAKEVKDTVRRYQNDPISYFIDKLDMKPEHIWDGVRLPAESVRDHQRTAEKAGHSVSKTYTAGRIVLWFLMTHYPSTVISTAPSHPQVEEQLWREIKTAYNNAKVPLGGKLTKTKLDLQPDNEKGEKWYAYGFSTKPDTASDEATRMQGFHNVWVLIIFDEANGVLSPIWKAAEALITSEKHKILVLGNPTTATGDFPACFSDSDFHKITVASTDTPNYKEDKEVIPGLATRNFVERIAKKFGEDSNIYKSRILGIIPKGDPNALISVDMYDRAVGRQHEKPRDHEKRYVVIDVADGGDDATVMYGFYNKTLIDEIILYGKKVEEVEAPALRFCKKIGGNTIVYDGDGCGRILGGLLEGSKGDNITLLAFEGSSKEVSNKDDFINMRGQGHWDLRCDFKNDEITLLIDDEELKEDIVSVRLIDYRGGQIVVEPKKDLKKRIGRSPDKGDTLMMMSACYDQIKPIKVRDRYLDDARKSRSTGDEGSFNLMG